ncbi:hypothetical protein RhiirC2_850042 [Rhizophagus irregularis]|uniref:Uncharacterized protein n=1 Tax=Rhizophagus irregularis TaxID=588596 RepID=A0A2N1N8V6_9GLOM|nr:hypothetical protein RhiirC2_850042 [Rhizophagus irregularis]
MSPPVRKASNYHPKNEWTISWDLVHHHELYGKTIEQQNDLYGTSLTYRTHYIPALDADTNNNLTPKKITPILRPCLGQCGHSVPFSGDLRLKFTPLHTLRTQAFTFSKYRLIIPNVLPSMVPILSTLDSYLNANSEIFNNLINLNLNISFSLFINNIFVRNRDLIIQLLEIAKQFLLKKNFIFYTDGSFSSLDVTSSSQIQMGFAWIETTDVTPNSGPLRHHTKALYLLICLLPKRKFA